MRLMNVVFLFALVAGLTGLAACEPTGYTANPSTAPTTMELPGGLPPSAGRTESEREARREYYAGPRGDEF